MKIADIIQQTDPDSLEMLDPDPYPDYMNPDPQNCLLVKLSFFLLLIFVVDGSRR
jgi:hypothetical protein